MMVLNGLVLSEFEAREAKSLLSKVEEEVRRWMAKRGGPTKIGGGFFRRSRKIMEKKEVVVVKRVVRS
jgi:hypothetical protein